MSNTTQIVQAVCNALIKGQNRLNELDAVMGDGEHGSNIKKCFSAVLDCLPQWEDADESALFNNIGMKLLSSGGGTATTLMGFALVHFSQLAKEQDLENPRVLAGLFAQTLESIQKKSQAKAGDKTLMDAMIPAVKRFTVAAEEGVDLTGCWKQAAAAAVNGTEATKGMIAKRGRGLYVGERGLGTADPGATSVSIILQTISELLE